MLLGSRSQLLIKRNVPSRCVDVARVANALFAMERINHADLRLVKLRQQRSFYRAGRVVRVTTGQPLTETVPQKTLVSGVEGEKMAVLR